MVTTGGDIGSDPITAVATPSAAPAEASAPLSGIGDYGTMVMPGGGGGNVIPWPSATAPTLALVCFTDADTKRKKALKASGVMSCIWMTSSVTCLSTDTSA